MTFPATVDTALKQTIFDWFQFREVNDNEKFPVFFNRELSISMRKYLQLLRIEPGQTLTFPDGTSRVVTYDWMIQQYREQREIGTRAGSTNDTEYTDTSTYGSMVGEKTSTRETDDHEVTDRDVVSNGGYTDSSSSTSKNKGKSENSQSSDSMTLGKSSPQSISYPSATGGMPNGLDWTYPSTQGENKGTSSANGKTEDEGQTSSSGSGSNNNTVGEDIDRQKTGLDEYTENSGQTTQGATNTSRINNGSSAESTDRKVMEAGRQIDPATLLENAVSFIQNSSAWKFLYNRLDTCFMGIYEQEV